MRRAILAAFVAACSFDSSGGPMGTGGASGVGGTGGAGGSGAGGTSGPGGTAGTGGAGGMIMPDAPRRDGPPPDAAVDAPMVTCTSVDQRSCVTATQSG